MVLYVAIVGVTLGTGRRCTRDELLLALNLYHKLTLGHMHPRLPAIVTLAAKMGRGSGSLAMKLCNFASLDSALILRGIKGLSGASPLDHSMGGGRFIGIFPKRRQAAKRSSMRSLALARMTSLKWWEEKAFEFSDCPMGRPRQPRQSLFGAGRNISGKRC